MCFSQRTSRRCLLAGVPAAKCIGSGKGEGSGPACMLATTHNLCCAATQPVPSIGDEKHGLASPINSVGNCWGPSNSNTSNSAEGETVELKGMRTGFILSITIHY